MAHTSHQVLFSCGGRTLQARPHWDPTTLHPLRTGEAFAERYPRWGLWSPCRAPNPGQKHVPTGLLLAYHGSRCQANRTHLRRVPVLCSTDSPPGPSTPDDPHHMAIHGLGAQSSWTSQEGTRRLHPLTCHHRQVHKMDRSSTDLRDQVRANRAVLS